jgi:chemosensory pili system protein ChpA (sensor histidine kinase/response regulator)
MQAGQDLDLATNDLGPLAWVLDELRKSLEAASAALRRFVRDTAQARGTDMAGLDNAQLRLARQQLHQAVGALEMVGLGAPALMLHAMEAAVQRFIDKPELCTDKAAATVERAGFALAEYLEAVLLGKPASSVALFPQYRDVQELAGAERIHPADLWNHEWRWAEPNTPAANQSITYDPAIRAKLDTAVLKLVKSGDPVAAKELADLSLSLAATQSARQPKIFWKVCAAYFEAVGLGALPLDIYVKRAGSRILFQYASLAKGELGVSDRLAQDLVFFCSQAVPPKGAQAPSLDAARRAWNLQNHQGVDYQTPQYGRYDPALLSQSRKRVSTAKETWSALSGGDASKLKGLAEQFNTLGETLQKLLPPSSTLAHALNTVVDSVSRSGRPPGAELAMEVATAVLYLEAALADLDPDESQLSERMSQLAARLDGVRQGGQPEPLEPWMEELYRRVSDRQTMGSVVGELRGTLAELEKLLDQYFRNLADKAPLRDAPAHLMQMRGVLSVLGLDQAANAVQRMRDAIEEIIVTEIDEERARAAGTFDKLGNNLGALGFLIDMLNYQPALAKKLFVWEESTAELRPLMGRAHHAPEHAHEHAHEHAKEPEDSAAMPAGIAPAQEPLDVGAAIAAIPSLDLGEVRPQAAAAPVPVTPPSAPVSKPAAASPHPAPAAAAQAGDEEDELLDIFLEEAREVVGNGLAAVEALATAPSDVGELTTLRRAFHTLKGSSRMVGLNEFGEAGWALEQVLNTWLADQKPASDDLRALASEALQGFGRWVEDIAAKNDGAWKAAAFRVPADALRTEGRLLSLALPGAQVAAPLAVEPSVVADAPVDVSPEAAGEPAAPIEAIELSVPEIEFELPATAQVPEQVPTPQAPAAPEGAAQIADFDISFNVPAAARQQPAEPQPATAAPDADMLFDISALEVSLVESAPQEAVPPAAALPEASPAEAVEATAEATAEATTGVRLESASFDQTLVIRGEASAAADVPAAELPPEFDFSASAVPQAVAELPEPVEIEGIDFGSLSAISALPPVDEPATAQPDAQEEDQAAPIAAESDEQVKVIGPLRIGIPLYNVYLNEADEWSRRLATELAEWALEMDKPVPETAIGIAHALGGSSATVGFESLSDIARSLESTLEYTRSLAWATPQHGKAFTDAAEEIRRLLHQFAAGFLKDPNTSVVAGLEALRELDIPPRADDSSGRIPLDDEQAVDFGGIEPVVAEVPTQEPRYTAPQLVQLAPKSAAATTVTTRTETAFDVHHDEEDIDVVDAVDADLFPIFEEEAIELLPQMGTALRQWSARPENRSARDEVLRALHTLKGSARLAGALRLGELAHRMESQIESLGSENFQAAAIDPVLQRFDVIQGNFEALRARGTVPHDAAAGQQESAVADAEKASPSPAQSAAAALAPLAQPAGLQRSLVAQAAQQAIVPRASGQAVRVRSQLLDRLMNQAGEVMITRSRLESELRQLRGSLNDLTGNLDRLRTQLREIELQAETQMQSRLALAKDTAAGFDPLEFDRFTRVQELTRFMAESVNDVATVQRNIQRVVESTEDDLVAQARQTRELQRDLLRTRMVEFEGISDRLYRVIRLASKEAGKQVKLDITGGSIEMDRGVLERMTPAFEHLLRNCVAHGIEDPAARAAAGKDTTGTITINLHQEGNDVSVEFRDDGAGLNLARIREKAVQQGLVGAGQEVSDAEAAQMIFMPGFSTASKVTELAGRGIGMDVVRAEVNALGGRIETATTAGQGTSFKLVLPLTTAVTQVVMIRAGKLSFGVPANLIEIVRRATAKEVEQAYNAGTCEFNGETLPFFWCGALLQSSQRSVAPVGKTLPLVIFRSAAQRVAVHVDEILGNQEVVVKNLGPQLSRLPGLAGMTALASGAVVLIYNPVALATVYGEQARRLSADHAQPEVLEQSVMPAQPAPVATPAAPAIPLVLVVDDSITVRRVTQRLLQREGYRVSLAADGLQALEKLAEEIPAVVLSDIEMPRMDGFDLARNIRNDGKLKDLPIIMITSRIAQKHREHAQELGVDHYLGKPYAEEELLALVRHYCTQGSQAVTA